jgi:hypothetical protein
VPPNARGMVPGQPFLLGQLGMPPHHLRLTLHDLDRETTRVLVGAVRVFIVELFALEDRTELPAIGEGVVAIGAEDFRTPPRGRRPLPCRQLTSRRRCGLPPCRCAASPCGLP